MARPSPLQSSPTITTLSGTSSPAFSSPTTSDVRLRGRHGHRPPDATGIDALGVAVGLNAEEARFTVHSVLFEETSLSVDDR